MRESENSLAPIIVHGATFPVQIVQMFCHFHVLLWEKPFLLTFFFPFCSNTEEYFNELVSGIRIQSAGWYMLLLLDDYAEHLRQQGKENTAATFSSDLFYLDF